MSISRRASLQRAVYGVPAQEFGRGLADLNLTTPSAHYDLNRFVSSSPDDRNRDLGRCTQGLRHFFVDQGGNFTHDPFRSVSDSAEYVKRVLLQR